jgi:AcrR family transcriptional regulator
MDRRVQKTKRLLTQALIDLILEKGYENVTVQSILDRANVGRSTFYMHYENKDLLFVDGPRNLGLSLFDQKHGAKRLTSNPMEFRVFFDHVNQNLPLAKATLGKRGGSLIIDSFRTQIQRAIEEHYRSNFSQSKKNKMRLGFLSQAASAGVMALVTAWVDSHLEISAEEMSSWCRDMIEGILG